MFLPERNAQIHLPRMCNVCEPERIHRVYRIASLPCDAGVERRIDDDNFFSLSSEMKGQSQWWCRSACIWNTYCCRIVNHMPVVYTRLVNSHRPHQTDYYSILWIDTAMHRRALRADENYMNTEAFRIVFCCFCGRRRRRRRCEWNMNIPDQIDCFHLHLNHIATPFHALYIQHKPRTRTYCTGTMYSPSI